MVVTGGRRSITNGLSSRDNTPAAAARTLLRNCTCSCHRDGENPKGAILIDDECCTCSRTRRVGTHSSTSTPSRTTMSIGERKGAMADDNMDPEYRKPMTRASFRRESNTGEDSVAFGSEDLDDNSQPTSQPVSPSGRRLRLLAKRMLREDGESNPSYFQSTNGNSRHESMTEKQIEEKTTGPVEIGRPESTALGPETPTQSRRSLRLRVSSSTLHSLESTFTKEAAISTHSAPQALPDSSAPPVPPSKPALPSLSYQEVKSSLQGHLKSLSDRHSFETARELRRNRQRLEKVACDSSDYVQTKSPFADMAPINESMVDKSHPGAFIVEETSIQIHNDDVSSSGTTQSHRTWSWSAPKISLASLVDPRPVPRFVAYLPVRENVLAENNDTLYYVPFFDPSKQDEAEEELSKNSGKTNNYKLVDYDKRLESLGQLHRSWYFRHYIFKFLKEELRLDFDAVERQIKSSNPLVKKTLDVSRNKDTRVAALEKLGEQLGRVSDVVARNTGLLAAAVMVVCLFNLKFILPFYEEDRSSESGDSDISESEDREYLRSVRCRICLRICCPYHGEIEEMDRKRQEMSKHRGGINVQPYDLGEYHDEWRNLNVKSYFTAPAHKGDNAEAPTRKTITPTQWITESTANVNLELRNPFYPCDHEGSCESAKCSCFLEKIPCEKFCGCSKSCSRRWQGCGCAQKGSRVCLNHCPCRQLNRECDPDLCGNCGAGNILDPKNRYLNDESFYASRCGNCFIQKNLPKRTLLGESQVEGFGVYAGEMIKKDEYIGEYRGEVITKQESERRATIYYYRKAAYVFKLNNRQEVDATNAGNKMKYVNHSQKNANCTPRTTLCNTVVRIGMFALHDIAVGEEVFFDYGDDYWAARENRKCIEIGQLRGSRTASPASSKNTNPAQTRRVNRRNMTLAKSALAESSSIYEFPSSESGGGDDSSEIDDEEMLDATGDD